MLGKLKVAALPLLALLVSVFALSRTFERPRAVTLDQLLSQQDSNLIGATGDNPAGWTINTGSGNLVAPSGKKITGLANGTASGDAVHLGQVPINARVVTTAALPAYTYNNGTSGVGRTITANANGACSAASFDGITLTVGDVVLVQNGASFADNGVYSVTSPLGDGSNPCKLTGVDYSDSQAEIVGSVVQVREGNSRSGAVYRYINSPSITMGTTALAWLRIDGNRTPNEVVELATDFEEQTAVLANNSILAGRMGLLASIGTNMAVALSAASATERGVLSIGSTTATSASASLTYSVATPSIVLASAQYFEIEARIAGPNALSDGTNTFRFEVGLGNAVTVSSTDGIWAEYTQATSTSWLGVNRASSTSSTFTGPTVATTTYTRWKAWKYAGESTVHHAFDNVEAGSGASNVPLSVPLTVMIAFTKSAGGTARTHTLDNLRFLQAWPNGRAA